MVESSQTPAQQPLSLGGRRGFWTRQIHRWHWISSGLCLAGMLLFAITGITLNHAGDIAGEPVVTSHEMTLSGPTLQAVQHAVPDGSKRPLPPSVRHAVGREFGVDLEGENGEWSEFEIFLAMPRPGGDATLTIDRETGATRFQSTDYGWVAYFNDLHKGRNTGTVWAWFIDLFAVACLVFSITGLILLQFHARLRPSTWPVVGFGLLLPVLLMLLLIHR